VQRVAPLMAPLEVRRPAGKLRAAPLSPPWHFTTWLDLLDHWQTIIAGLIALIAAIITVRVTLRVERGKAGREVDALRRSLALDLRQQIHRALGVYESLALLGSRPDGPISARMVESKINERGERLSWLGAAPVNRLRAIQGPGESSSDVILRPASIEVA
jgi:hypothetical protein